jgi:hypothetical protein
MIRMKTLEVIATIQSNFPEVVYIYETDDNGDYVVAAVGSAWRDSVDFIENIKPRRYKLYYSKRRDSYYFMKNGRRFYLDEAIRTNL